MRSLLVTTLIVPFVVACDGGSTASKDAKPAQAAAAPTPAPAPAAPPKAEPAPAAPVATAELGQPAPDFELADLDGTKHTLAAYKGKIVVLEWFNPECPFVKFAHGEGPLKDMAKRMAGPDLVWLSINSGAPGKQGAGLEASRKGVGDYAMANPVLLDEDGKVGRTYGAQKTPHMYVVDKDGKLVYRGGLDNAPQGEVDGARPKPAGAKDGELVKYVEAALADVRAGKPVALADTPAYGCSVKYAS